MAAPGYLKARGTPQTPANLLDHSCLHHKFPSTGKLERWPLHADGGALDIELPATLVASTIEPLLSLAEQGIGIACLPDFVVARYIEAGRLVQILEEHTANAGTFRLLWPSTRYPSPKLTAFTEFMAKHLFGVTIRK